MTEITETAHHQYGVTFPIAAKAGRHRSQCPSLLQMGRGGPPPRGSPPELPQISDRPRRLHRGGVPAPPSIPAGHADHAADAKALADS